MIVYYTAAPLTKLTNVTLGSTQMPVDQRKKVPRKDQDKETLTLRKDGWCLLNLNMQLGPEVESLKSLPTLGIKRNKEDDEAEQE